MKNVKKDPNFKYGNIKSGCVALYRAFDKYGIDNFEYEILEDDAPLKDINEIEDYYIITMNTLIPNGYNMRLNESAYSQVPKLNSDKVSKSKRRYVEETKGLPMYVTFYQDKDGYRGYKLDNHPLYKDKSFTSKTVPLEILKQNC